MPPSSRPEPSQASARATLPLTWKMSLAHLRHRLCWQGRITTGLVNISRQMGQMSCFSRLSMLCEVPSIGLKPTAKFIPAAPALPPPHTPTGCANDAAYPPGFLDLACLCLSPLQGFSPPSLPGFFPAWSAFLFLSPWLPYSRLPWPTSGGFLTPVSSFCSPKLASFPPWACLTPSGLSSACALLTLKPCAGVHKAIFSSRPRSCDPVESQLPFLSQC